VRRKRLVAVLATVLGGLLTLSVLFFVGAYVFSVLGDCSGKERALVKEYPHYHRSAAFDPTELFSCQVSYHTEASRKEVLSYYDKLLRQNNWKVVGFRAYYYPKGMEDPSKRPPKIVTGKRLSDLSEAPESAEVSLFALRDGYGYWVTYRPPNEMDSVFARTSVSILVRDHPPPASRLLEERG
jgi:hypothetical protein